MKQARRVCHSILEAPSRKGDKKPAVHGNAKSKSHGDTKPKSRGGEGLLELEQEPESNACKTAKKTATKAMKQVDTAFKAAKKAAKIAAVESKKVEDIANKSVKAIGKFLEVFLEKKAQAKKTKAAVKQYSKKVIKTLATAEKVCEAHKATKQEVKPKIVAKAAAETNLKAVAKTVAKANVVAKAAKVVSKEATKTAQKAFGHAKKVINKALKTAKSNAACVEVVHQVTALKAKLHVAQLL